MAMAENSPSWTDLLDVSERGIFASFWAIPLSVPFVIIEYFLLSDYLAEMLSDVAPQPVVLALPVLLLSVVGTWIVTLLVVARLAKSAKLGHRYGYFLASFYWSSLLI